MAFNNNTISLTLIRKAQKGCKESLSTLIESVKDDIQAYLYRLTLDTHLTEDLYQETIMDLVKHLPGLNFTCTRAFWGWLYKIALSKVCHQVRKKASIKCMEHLKKIPAGFEQTPPHELMKKELTQAIYEAISSLKVSYRNVITLRCFNQLSYAEIAGITGGTQMQAKLRFFRAKKALERKLRKNGFKESHLLVALGLFATITHKSAVAGSVPLSVSAATMKVGFGTSLLAAVVSKLGLTAAVCSIILIGVLETKKVNPSYDNEPSEPLAEIIKDMDYVYPVLVSQSYDPDESGWQSMVYTEQGRYIELVNPENILLKKEISSDSSLILPANHWVQVVFNSPLLDRPGVDIFITGYGAANIPSVLLVGPGDELLELVPAHIRAAPSDFTIVGYDLAGINPTFESYQIRVSNLSSETEEKVFRLQTIRARELEEQ